MEWNVDVNVDNVNVNGKFYVNIDKSISGYWSGTLCLNPDEYWSKFDVGVIEMKC